MNSFSCQPILFYKCYIWNIDRFLPRGTFVNNQWTKDAERRVVFKLFIYYLYHLKCWKCVREECIVFKNVMIKNIVSTKCDVVFRPFLECFDKHWYSIMGVTLWHNITKACSLQRKNTETKSTDVTFTTNLKCYKRWKPEKCESKAEFKCSSFKWLSPPSKKHGKAVQGLYWTTRPPQSHPPTDKKHLNMPHPIQRV